MRAFLHLHPCPIQSSLLSPAAPHVPSPLSDGCRVFGNPLTQLTTQLSSTHPPASHLSVPSTVPKRCPHSLSNAGYYISLNGFSKVLHPVLEILYLQNLESILKKHLRHAGRTLLQHQDFPSLQFIIPYEFSDFFTPCSFKFLDVGY